VFVGAQLEGECVRGVERGGVDHAPQLHPRALGEVDRDARKESRGVRGRKDGLDERIVHVDPRAQPEAFAGRRRGLRVAQQRRPRPPAGVEGPQRQASEAAVELDERARHLVVNGVHE
jgi:hypothetical protein